MHTLPGARLIFVLIFFSGVPLPAHTQHTGIDAFTGFLKETRDEPVDKLLSRTQEALEAARDVNDLQAEAEALTRLGMIHLERTSDYEEAIDFLIQGLAVYDSLALPMQKIVSYFLIAHVFEEVGNPVKSEEMLVQAQLINRQLGDKRMGLLLLARLGKVNAAQGNLEEAFATYEEVLRQVDATNDPALEAEAVFNLAHLYTQQGNFERALEYHKRALVIIRSVHDRAAEATSLNDVGELYRMMNNTERAFANHNAALEIRSELKDQKGIAASHNNLGVLHFQQRSFSEAIADLGIALANARESQAREEIRKAHEYLSLCYEATGDYKTALAHKEELITISDFIQREKNERLLLEAQSRYVIDGKQSQIRSLESIRMQREAELREQKQFRDFLFAVIALSGVIILLATYMYFAIRRSNKKLKVAHDRVQEQNVELHDLNATKDKFFSIIGHDLKGPLNSLTSFSGLLINHTDSLTKDEIRMLAKDLDKSLKNLFALLENLLEWSRSQTGNIDFKREDFDIMKVLEENRTLLQAQAQHKSITITLHENPPMAIHAHKHSVNTVVRNLVSNAIKFTPPGGRIDLRVMVTNGGVVVSVADTGVGMSEAVVQKLFRIDAKHSTKGTADEKGTGLGLILCKEFVEKNGGAIWVESIEGKGTTFHFSMPASVGIQSTVAQYVHVH